MHSKRQKGVIQEKENELESGITIQIPPIVISSFYLFSYVDSLIKSLFWVLIAKKILKILMIIPLKMRLQVSTFECQKKETAKVGILFGNTSSKSTKCCPITKLGYFYRNTFHRQHNIIMAAHKDAMAEWKV